MKRTKALALLTAAGQPCELEEVAVYGRRCKGFVHAPPTLRDLYFAARRELPFLVYEDERITFAEAWDRAARIAQLLRRDCGIEKGDRIAISMRNYPEWTLCFMAATSIGCIAVESALLEHPEVLEACVYAVPDERLGEEVGATLYVTGAVQEAELREFLQARLARFEIPRYFKLHSQPLPRTGSGKIFKRQLRQAAID